MTGLNQWRQVALVAASLIPLLACQKVDDNAVGGLEFDARPVDLKITDSLSGKSYGVQLKASENINYIEETLRKYPDTPIIVPKGVAEKVNHPLVMDGNYTADKINEINDANFEKILEVRHLNKHFLQIDHLFFGIHFLP